MLRPTPEETAERDAVMERVRRFVREGRTIKLPQFDPGCSRPDDRFALVSVGREPNEFRGTVGEFSYQLEGEEDLLHLFVVRTDAAALEVAEGQAVASFVLGDLPTALVWLRPGEYSQHFYFGHDHLLA